MTTEETAPAAELTLEDLVAALLPQTPSVSPYKISQVATVLMGRLVRPQVLYAYVREGVKLAQSGQKVPNRIPRSTRGRTGHWEVTRAEAARWVLQYVDRNGDHDLDQMVARVQHELNK